MSADQLLVLHFCLLSFKEVQTEQSLFQKKFVENLDYFEITVSVRF